MSVEPGTSAPIGTTPPVAPSTYPPTPRALYTIKAGLILSRSPVLTREPTPFESAFYLYQKRLNERLSGPFSKKFYLKPKHPQRIDFQLKLRDRRSTMARDIGLYRKGSRYRWNDEVTIDRPPTDEASIREALYTAAESRVSEDGEPLSFADRIRIERPRPRETEADRAGDVRRLDRRLDRTLYLVLRYPDGQWRFPAGAVRTDEVLHETTARVLQEAAGVNMNVWTVARHPVAHMVTKPKLKDGDQLKEVGEKVFFLKGRILAGQVDLKDNKPGITDFNWLTKEELETALHIHLYNNVKGMMPER